MTGAATTAPAGERLTSDELRDLAQQLRVDAVRAVAAAGSGHATSALSADTVAAKATAAHHR